MYCISCGTTNLEGAVHCHNCGTKLASEQPANQTQEVAAAAQQQQPVYQDFTQVPPQGGQQVPPQQGYQQAPQQPNYQQVPPQGFAQGQSGNNFQQQPQGNFQPQQGYQQPYVVASVPAKDQLKQVKDYFKYVLAILKRPHVEAFSKDKNQILFGTINIIAFAVLFGLTTWIFMSSVMNEIFDVSAPFGSSFIVPILVSAIFLAIGGCIAFGLAKLNKVDVKFVDVLSQWFAYMALPAAIMPLIFLTTIVGLFKFTLVLLAVVLITIFASAASIVQNYKLGEKHAIDPMYSTGIFFAVLGLILYVILNQFADSIVTLIGAYIGNSFSKMFGNW